MREFFIDINNLLKPLGYKKSGNSFWKVSDGFYRIINFQTGAHGGGYYFVNLGIHPIAFPDIRMSKLTFKEKLKEQECIFRTRIESVTSNSTIQNFRQKFVKYSDDDVLKALMSILPNEIEAWFREWSSYEKITNSEYDELEQMLNMVPILKKKVLFLLKSYCYIKLGDEYNSTLLYELFLNEKVDGIDIDEINEYFKTYLLKLHGEKDTSNKF